MKIDGLEAVWKALADPTRRQLLDALRDGPQTTGALCRRSRLSRFAIMKHLGVLHAAKLVVVRRQGRLRWNHLNAVPIQEIYQRWVQPYAAHRAGGLLQFRDHIESRTGAGPVPSKTDFGVVQVELEIVIDAAPRRVWQALVEETSQWWLEDFYTSSAARGFIIEPQLGGRVYEDWGDGAGQVWYTVIGLDAPHFIMMLGHLTPDFGGPATTMLQLRLRESGEATMVQLSDTISGRAGDGKSTQTRDGWKLLFETGLKRHVETASKSPGSRRRRARD